MTINYITSDNADTNKELGAYYTPSEITRFSAEETVRPALLDRFKLGIAEGQERSRMLELAEGKSV